MIVLSAPASDPAATLPEEFQLAVITFDSALTAGGEPAEVVIFVDMEYFA